MAEALSPALPNALEEQASTLLRELCDRELTVATAESCTGGLLASLLTDVPGCSHAFERGFVTYTDGAKRELLDVPADVLENDGAVSPRAACAMATGALERSRADLALSVTGYADEAPDGRSGEVHFAAARRGRPPTHRFERFGRIGRAKVRLACLGAALEMLDAQMRGG